VIAALLFACAGSGVVGADPTVDVDVAPRAIDALLTLADVDCEAYGGWYRGLPIGVVGVTSYAAVPLDVEVADTMPIIEESGPEITDHSFLAVSFVAASLELRPDDSAVFDVVGDVNCRNHEPIAEGVHPFALEVRIDGEPFAIDVSVSYSLDPVYE
jgi:hypothetical protein